MNKHIVVLDVETTGLDRDKDFIIQLSAIKVDRETNQIVDTFNQYIQPSGSYVMSIGAIAKHHITPNFLKDKPLFVEIAHDFMDFISCCDLLGYNSLGFDLPFIKREMKDAGIDFRIADFNCYDAFLEEKRRLPATLEGTYARYKGTTMEEDGLEAHDALSDVKATYEVFRIQNNNMPYEPEEILCEDGFFKIDNFNGKYEPCFTQGKYRGVGISYAVANDKGYLNWILNNPGFDESTKKIVRENLSK